MHPRILSLTHTCHLPQEMVENLVHLGLHTSVVEMLPQVGGGLPAAAVHQPATPPPPLAHSECADSHASSCPTSQVMPPFDREMVEPLHAHLRSKGVPPPPGRWRGGL